jgi:nitroreductase/NAD-dependent dihydropyrimidine dehydrogenase PreA subunit
MGLLTIDESKCTKDGFCAQECPAVIIRFSERSFPKILPIDEARCMDCGHCVAVCPHDALDHARIPMSKSPSIRKDLQINEAQAIQFLRSRRSIRRYQNRPVEKELIQKLIETARYAPTAGNSQTIEWLVITDKTKLREIGGLTVDWLREIAKNPQVIAAAPYIPTAIAAWDSGYDAVLRGAPAVVIAMAPKEAMNGLVDLTLALSYIDVLAQTMELGTCWAGLLEGALSNSETTRAAVGIPGNFTHHYPIMLGYADVKYSRLPERKTPKITFM